MDAALERDEATRRRPARAAAASGASAASTISKPVASRAECSGLERSCAEPALSPWWAAATGDPDAAAMGSPGIVAAASAVLASTAAHVAAVAEHADAAVPGPVPGPADAARDGIAVALVSAKHAEVLNLEHVMATYGCTVEWDGVNAVLKGQRGLSAVTRFGPGTYLVTVDPIVSLAASEFSVSGTLCNFAVPMGQLGFILPIKSLVNQNQLFVLTAVDNVTVDSSFDLIVETYRS